jgi:hypothetical protein
LAAALVIAAPRHAPEALTGRRSPAESAAVATAEALACICTFTREHRDELLPLRTPMWHR